MSNFWNDYAEWTEQTAQYPKHKEPEYLALGIAEETGEVSLAANYADKVKEVGDVLWYLSRYCRHVLHFPFQEIVNMARTWDHHKFEEKEVFRYVTTIAGIEKKRLRDGYNWDAEKTDAKRYSAIQCSVFIVAYLIAELKYGFKQGSVGETLEDAAKLNQEKLTKRVEKGTIQGDGDHR